MLKQNGTTEAHGREWPLYEHQVFGINIAGYVDFSGLRISEASLKAAMEESLRRILEPHGVKANLYPTMRLFMSPEDQAEKNALDEESIKRAA